MLYYLMKVPREISLHLVMLFLRKYVILMAEKQANIMMAVEQATVWSKVNLRLCYALNLKKIKGAYVCMPVGPTVGLFVQTQKK